MQEIKLTKAPSIKIILDSGEYIMRRPTVGESRDLQRRLDEDGANSIDIMCKLMDALGMPENIAEGLDNDEMAALIKGLVPPKKK